jgi:hypothetical protein
MKRLYKHIFLVLILVASCSELFAQEVPRSALIFQNSIHDFGHIDEEGGVVTCSFDGVNTSNYPIEIEKIVTTCGCTTVEFDKKTIPAGGIFSFKVAFSPLNRPGRIDKQIFVLASDAPTEIVLNIIGYVNARERTIDELYPFDMGGGLHLKSNFHAFGYLEHGKEITEHIGYVNTSSRAITLDIDYTTESGLLDITYPTLIEAGARGDITLRYTVDEKSNIYGTKRDVMMIRVDNTPSPYTLTSQVIVVDNFDNMDDISAPMLVISKNIIKFGEVNCSNDVMEQRVVLTNEGASPLVVRAVESSSQAVECLAKRDIIIAPGASHEVVVRLYAPRIEDVDNPFVARIYFITNDPLRPMQSVRVNALPL